MAKVTWHGHATCTLQTDSGSRLVIDPFFGDNPSFDGSVEDVPGADYILCTHGHFDHFADCIPLAKRTGATVVSTFEIASFCQQKGVDKVHGIMPFVAYGDSRAGEMAKVMTLHDKWRMRDMATEGGTTYKNVRYVQGYVNVMLLKKAAGVASEAPPGDRTHPSDPGPSFSRRVPRHGRPRLRRRFQVEPPPARFQGPGSARRAHADAGDSR